LAAPWQVPIQWANKRSMFGRKVAAGADQGETGKPPQHAQKSK